MKSIPGHLAAYRRTLEFDQANVPETWLNPHSTKKNVWAKIVVLEGRLRLTILSPEEEVILDPDHPGIVEPRSIHFVTILGIARFYIEFYR
ncbi:MAG: DUF1971 domain-containing protein [Gammaproteobacteria bacterium]|nr:DUF1971 domain-containing protein [Gammaproteobacteria bacterium]